MARRFGIPSERFGRYNVVQFIDRDTPAQLRAPLPPPGDPSHLRCDWCGRDHRRWFVQKVCTSCVAAPHGYHRKLYELTAWGVACATCGLIGYLAAWVTK